MLPAVAALLLLQGTAPAPSAAPKALEPLSFLLGDWQAQGGGKPGEPSGGFSFAPQLQERVIVRTNFAEYPATAGKPASRHDDLMVIFATEAGDVRADYYDSEGHVIRYLGTVPAPGQLRLVSEPGASAPRFRLSYKLNPDGTLDGRFEVAPPGKPEAFAPYLSWTGRRNASRR